jgi:hypothetical protein
MGDELATTVNNMAHSKELSQYSLDRVSKIRKTCVRMYDL